MILIASVLPAGAPNQVHIEAVPFEITEDRVTLRWTAPRDNGAVITEYTISRVERGILKVKCFAQEHNTLTRPGLEPRPLDRANKSLT